MSPKHCNNQDLLAYLDGELPSRQAFEVSEHLSSCWRCRSRAGDLENQIRTLTREFTAGNFPDRTTVTAAKNTFLKWRDEYDRESSAIRFVFLDPPVPTPVVLALLALALIVLALFTHSRPHLSPQRVLARAQSAEQLVIANASIHESYLIEIKRNSTSIPAPKSNLEIWSEPSADRFAWRLKDQQHHLQFAEWNPGRGEHYVFDRTSSAAIPKKSADKTSSASLVEIFEPSSTLEQANLSFVGWVKSRRWRVISIATDFASFSSQNDTSFSMRRVRSLSGALTLVLKAVCIRGDKKLELLLQVDEATGRPFAEIARVTDSHSSIEFRVLVNRVESVHVISAALKVFRPEIAILREHPAKPLVASRPVHPRAANSYVDPRLLDDAEVQVLYTLHRAGLCLGAPITVDQNRQLSFVHLDQNWQPSFVHVDGLVENPQVRDKIVSDVAALTSARLVRINLKTFEEAAAGSAPLRFQAAAGPAGSTTVPVETLIDQSPLPEDKKSALKKNIAEVSNQLVSATETLSRESWALNRLAKQFSPNQIDTLGIESRNLLAMMANDHLLALDHTISTINTLTAPFSPVAAPGNPSADRPFPAAAVDNTNVNDWGKAFNGLTDQAEFINRQSQFLFALGGSSQLTPSDSAQHLLAALQNFPQILAQAGIRVKELNKDVNSVLTSPPKQTVRSKTTQPLTKSTTEVDQ